MNRSNNNSKIKISCHNDSFSLTFELFHNYSVQADLEFMYNLFNFICLLASSPLAPFTFFSSPCASFFLLSFFPSIFLPFYLYFFLSSFLSFYLSFFLSIFIYLFIYLFIYFYLSSFLSFIPSVFLSSLPSIFLPFFLYFFLPYFYYLLFSLVLCSINSFYLYGLYTSNFDFNVFIRYLMNSFTPFTNIFTLFFNFFC